MNRAIPFTLLLFLGCHTLNIRPLRPDDYDFYEIDETIDEIRSDGAVFRKRPEAAHVDCSQLLRHDKAYIKEIASNRPKLVERGNKLGMTCPEIQKRILPARNPDTGFPILFARIVYKDYEFLEDQLATNYAIENVYCFSIDKKVSPEFRERFYSLERCLPNVVVVKKEHDVDSAGHNQNEAHFDCMQAARDRQWEYAVLMQNHDVIIKTHGEMTEILRIFGGANDVDIEVCPDHRCIESLEKNLGKLGLCPKNLTGEELIKCQSTEIQWGKGAMQAILSRAAVDFILDEIDVFPLMHQMNAMGYGVDEQLYNSLQINPEIRLPGGFHHKCREKEAQTITRVVKWYRYYYGAESLIKWGLALVFGDSNACRSGMIRHSVCINGVEDLPNLAASKAIMANKMMPDFDHAVTTCISELLFNRTKKAPRIDQKYYANINAVRYHHERNLPYFNIDEFECEV